jgi:hypothetical protein
VHNNNIAVIPLDFVHLLYSRVNLKEWRGGDMAKNMKKNSFACFLS